MRKITILFLGSLLLLGLASKIDAQSSPVTSGGEATGSGGTVSYSIGEVSYSSYVSAGGIVIEGMQQVADATTLPMTLLQLNVTVTDKKEVALSWTIVSGCNTQYYTVEVSSDGVNNFKKVLTLNGKNNGIAAQTYEAVDVKPKAGASYYRLKQTGLDGRSSYSDIISVNIVETTIAQLSVYPNPTTTILNLQIKDATFKMFGYSFYTSQGKLLYQQKINSNLTTINTSTLATGIYTLQIADGKNVLQSFKIIKK